MDCASEPVSPRLHGSLDQDLQPIFIGGYSAVITDFGLFFFVSLGQLQFPSGIVAREQGAEPVPCPVAGEPEQSYFGANRAEWSVPAGQWTCRSETLPDSRCT